MARSVELDGEPLGCGFSFARVQGISERRHLAGEVLDLVRRQHPWPRSSAHVNNRSRRNRRKPGSRLREGGQAALRDVLGCAVVEFRWQPQALRALTRLRTHPGDGPPLADIADTLHALELELPDAPGKGHMWVVPIQNSEWTLVCSDDEPGVLVISYLGPKLI